jgi:hypothetical protein
LPTASHKPSATSKNRRKTPLSDEQPKPKLEVISTEQLDEDEAEFRALRRDLPGVKGASEAGLLAISVGRQPTPRNEFYRTHADFRPVVPLVNIEVGMDRQFVAVMPDMVAPLAGIGIMVTDHALYLTVTPRGALRIIPCGGPNAEGEQNEWNRTKETALIDGIDGWVRMYSDREGNCYKSFPAPAGRFGDPNWPTIKPAKIIRLAFRDRGRLIDSTDHVLVQKWAGRDRG